VDAPNVDDPASVADVLGKISTGEIQLVASEPEAFFFPRAIWVSGPLHVVWNAFEKAVQSTPGWPTFKESLAGILAFLGNQPIKDRFMALCMGQASAQDRQHFYNRQHAVIEWKWEYMEEVFCKLADSVDVFFKYFVADKMRHPRDGVATDEISAKCVQVVEMAQRDSKRFTAMCEMFAVFSRACGGVSRWFTGCRCHDHIWQEVASDVVKHRKFVNESAPGVKVHRACGIIQNVGFVVSKRCVCAY
jgi:hypothetical protein